MKFDSLRAIAHNIAASLASGVGLPVGIYDTDIFGDAARGPKGVIAVDFLAGKCTAGDPSAKLTRAIALYQGAFEKLCKKHGITVAAFREVSAQYAGEHPYRGRFIVTVEDRHGYRAVDEYVGTGGHRVKILDPLGRIRRKRGPVIAARRLTAKGARPPS